MTRQAGSVVLMGEDLVVTRRALHALIASHGGGCTCHTCSLARPLLGRLEDKLTTPGSRAAVDQGEGRG